jgi:enediyne polyketide synthase
MGAAFARTLYLEHPRLTVCVIHLPLDLPSLTTYIVAEVQAARSFVEASYDMQGKRRESVLIPYTNTMANAPLKLDRRDVLLVTGGGKGIAAECAFALAQETGVTLALLGRSRPQDDSVLARHLAKLEAAGVRYHYVPIDVQDANGVVQAVHEVEAQFGPITAILHGAGVNKPSLLNMLGEETLKKTLAPKVNGLQNLL